MSAASPLETVWVRHRLRAPSEQCETLAIPPLNEMPAAVASNREQIASWNYNWLGKPLHDLRRLAREDAITAARQYTDWLDSLSPLSRFPSFKREGRGETPRADNAPLILSGHQPELIHPGVWAKNFTLDGLAQSTGGCGLHLIVDNDALRSTRIAVPIGSRAHPAIEFIPFDADAGSSPWEKAVVRDEALFASFAHRVSSALACWPISPLLRSIWPAACAAITSTNPRRATLADALTAARHAIERHWGLNNLELPMSRLCHTEGFAWFVCRLFSDVRKLHADYNAIVETYRRVNRIRSVSHPVPNLVGDSATSSNNWLEVPLWVWRESDSRRQRLFAKATASHVTLSDGREVLASLPLSADGTADRAVSQLRDLFANGLNIRTRALTTTMFARVCLGDIFLHGLGGAKYDEMTDRLIARLFGLTPPSYLTVTATMHLPLASWDVSPVDVAELRHRLWDFDHNAERHVPSTCWPEARRVEVEALLSERRGLIAEQIEQDAMAATRLRRHTRSENFQRCRRLKALNRRLAELAGDTRRNLVAAVQTARSCLDANSILRSREYSFCLFPEESLRPMLLGSRTTSPQASDV